MPFTRRRGQYRSPVLIQRLLSLLPVPPPSNTSVLHYYQHLTLICETDCIWSAHPPETVPAIATALGIGQNTTTRAATPGRLPHTPADTTGQGQDHPGGGRAAHGITGPCLGRVRRRIGETAAGRGTSGGEAGPRPLRGRGTASASRGETGRAKGGGARGPRLALARVRTTRTTSGASGGRRNRRSGVGARSGRGKRGRRVRRRRRCVSTLQGRCSR